MNTALHCNIPDRPGPLCSLPLIPLAVLASDTEIRKTDLDTNDEQNTVGSMCQRNIELALSKLTLFVEPSYDMTLALVLGVCSVQLNTILERTSAKIAKALYAIQVSHPSLAGALIHAAYQCSYTLGFHKSTNALSEPQKEQFLFWAIYFFEKTTSVRLVRSSIIRDCDIEDPSPHDLQSKNPYFTAYMYSTVKVAGLTGRIYEELYSPKGLGAPDDIRTHRTLELSQELHEHHSKARDVNVCLAPPLGLRHRISTDHFNYKM